MHELMMQIVVMAGGYFAIMNPIANTAIFTSLTADMDAPTVKRVARTSVRTAFFTVLTFILLGKLIFTFFGVSLPALRVTGGIMIALIGYHMMHGKASRSHSAADAYDGDDATSIAISPLGMPILAGPGTIVVAMNYSATNQVPLIVANVAVFLGLCLVTYACFLLGERVERRLGVNGLKVVTQLMGLILAVIGVQMGLTGIFGAIRMYLHVG